MYNHLLDELISWTDTRNEHHTTKITF